jgi:hypothetical protein
MTTFNLRPSEPIKSAAATATGTLVATQAGRLRGVYVRSAGTAGTAVFKDGGSTGTTILTINTPAAVGGVYHDIPGGGIAFATDLHVTLTTADGVTAYYAED